MVDLKGMNFCALSLKITFITLDHQVGYSRTRDAQFKRN